MTDHTREDPLMARHASPLGKLLVEVKTSLTEEARDDLRIKCAELGLEVAEGVRDLIWVWLYGQSFSEKEAEALLHKVERRRAAMVAQVRPDADKSPSNVVGLPVLGEVSAK